MRVGGSFQPLALATPVPCQGRLCVCFAPRLSSKASPLAFPRTGR